MRPIHVGILLSHDYKYLPLCLSCIYAQADKITLAIDKKRLTWNGEKYSFDEEFLQNILKNDLDHKISVYEDDFSIENLAAWECDHRERCMLRDYMKSKEEKAWHLQIDSDEYFIDFKGFVKYLHDIENRYQGNITVMAKLVTIFKELKDGIILAIDEKYSGHFPVASIGGCRFTPAPDEIVVRTGFEVLHQSWGRSEEEIKFKIENWGHNRDFNTQVYFEFWKSVTKYNAYYIRDCHPLGVNSGWNRLKFIKGSINDILSDLKANSVPIMFTISTLRRARLARLKKKLMQTKNIRKIVEIIKYGSSKH